MNKLRSLLASWFGDGGAGKLGANLAGKLKRVPGASLAGKARKGWGVGLVAAVVLAALLWLGVRPGGRPAQAGTWRQGDWWVVSTRVPRDAARMATLGWSDGPVYRFTVRDAAKVKGSACWRVELEQLPAGGQPIRLASLFYTRDRLVLVDARYYAPGGQEVGWPSAAAYIRLPVVLPRLDRVAQGRSLSVPRQGVVLRAEALEPAPGQTQVWSDGAPWWVRFNADGLLRAELTDSSWWHQQRRPSQNWRQTLKGSPGEMPSTPYQQGSAAPTATTPPGSAEAPTPATKRPVTVKLWLDGQLAGETREGEVPWQQGTVPLSMYRRGEQAGVLYFSVLDPAAGKLRLDRLVLIRPEYLDQPLSDLEGVWAGNGPLKLATGKVKVEIQMGAPH